MGVGNRAYSSAAAAMARKGGIRAVQREEYSALLQANPDGPPMGHGSRRMWSADLASDHGYSSSSADENPCDGGRGLRGAVERRDFISRAMEIRSGDVRGWVTEAIRYLKMRAAAQELLEQSQGKTPDRIDG